MILLNTTNMERRTKVYLADDHQVLIDGMKALLKTSKQFEVVGYSLNGVNLIEDVIKAGADILVMDINMPEKNGIDVLKELAGVKKSFKIIVLSSYDDLKLVREVMNLGARGYLTKQCAGENIIEALQKVQKGEDYMCKTILDKICGTFSNNFQHKSLFVQKVEITLTDRELQIIKLICLERNTKEIADALFVSVHTVETHRKNLIKKLNVKSSIGLVKFAFKNNLISMVDITQT